MSTNIHEAQESKIQEGQIIDFLRLQTTNEMFKDYPDILEVRDIQKILHINRTMVYELINKNQIKSFRIGRIHKIQKSQLINYIINQ